MIHTDCAAVPADLLPVVTERQPSSEEVNMSEGRSSTESATASQAMLALAGPSGQEGTAHISQPGRALVSLYPNKPTTSSVLVAAACMHAACGAMVLPRAPRGTRA